MIRCKTNVCTARREPIRTKKDGLSVINAQRELGPLEMIPRTLLLVEVHNNHFKYYTSTVRSLASSIFRTGSFEAFFS